jgi:Xaa-Pro aminopeptidase
MRQVKGDVLAIMILVALPAAAQRTTYPPEEFGARRQALCGALEDGSVLLFGNTTPPPGVRPRQDNDFFYLTGVEDLNAALLVRVEDCSAHLYLPAQGAREVRSDGPNLISQGVAAESVGLAAIHPLTLLEEHLARQRGDGPVRLWVRMGEADTVDSSRGDIGLYLARRFTTGFGGQPSENAWRLSTLRSRFPDFRLDDVTPTLDRLRTIKTPREIEVLRRNGRVSAEGMRRAIAVTRPGLFEYHLEAAAKAWFDRQGAEGVAYPAIVASGPNLLVWHYWANSRQLEADDLVVMDFGADMGHLTMDITRTWPVDGEFDELQLRAYRCVLEAEKAIIAAMRSGVTREQTAEVAAKVYEKWGFGEHRAGGAGHYVGMATHDVGDESAPFAPGMVIAVEPIIALDDEELHVRVEDTVLITADGAEILSAGVPKEVDELLALVGSTPAGADAAP